MLNMKSLKGRLAIGAATLACAGLIGAGGYAFALDYVTPKYDWYFDNPNAQEFTIKTAGQLQALSDLVGGTAFDDDGNNLPAVDFAGKTVRLGNSVSLLSSVFNYEFVPIGTPEAPFNGTFDGAGNSVSDLHITSETQSSYVGLFGYCGPKSVLKDVSIEDDSRIDIAVTESDVTVRDVGALVGLTEGDVQGCSSRATVSVSWDDGEQGKARVQENTVVVQEVGGVVGYCMGNMDDLSFSGSLDVSTSADSYYDKAEGTNDAIVVRYVGGVAGGCCNEDWRKKNKTGNIDGCSNTGNVTVTTTGDGGKDRFGEVVESKCEYLGGITGYACGNISSCTNTGAIRGTSYVPTGDEQADASGYNHAAGGGQATGGIVGALRPNVGKSSDPLVISNCRNEGMIFSLSNVGGIAGVSGGFTTITRCSNGDAGKVRKDENVALVRGTRWNKPCIGGVVGSMYGNVTYCRNHGQVDTMDIGYYVGGVVGNLTYYTTDSGFKVQVPEVYACYNTGQVDCMESYRRGALVGGNGGYVHDCVFLSATATIIDGDFSAIGQNYGTYTRLQTAYSSSYEARVKGGYMLKSKNAVAALNNSSALGSWEDYYLLAGSENGGYPVLNGEGSSSAVMDLSALNPSVVLKTNAAFTASCNPEPELTVTIEVGGKAQALVQNADYYVGADSHAVNASGVCVGVTNKGETPYQCTLVGIGDYSGTADGCAYGISKGAFSECTVLVEEATYTGEAQNHPLVTVVDPAGGVVDAASYTYTVNDGKDCVRPTNADVDTYPVVAVAKDSSNYCGSAQGAYTINKVDIARECDTVGLIYGKRVWYYDDERFQLYEVVPVLDAHGELTYHEDTGYPVVEGEETYTNADGLVYTRATPKELDTDGRTVYGMSETYNAGTIDPQVIGVLWNGKPLSGYGKGTAGDKDGWWHVVYGGGSGGSTVASTDSQAAGEGALRNIEAGTTGAVTVAYYGLYTRNYVVLNFGIEKLDASPQDFAAERKFWYFAYNGGSAPVKTIDGKTTSPIKLTYRGNVVDPANYELVPSYSVDNATGQRHEGADITFNSGDTVHYDLRFKRDGSIACEDIEDVAYFTIIASQSKFDETTVSVSVDSSTCRYNFGGCSDPVVEVRDKATGEKLVEGFDYRWDISGFFPGTRPLNVIGIGKYAGAISTTCDIAAGVLTGDMFDANGVATSGIAKIAEAYDQFTLFENADLTLPWRASGYSKDALENSVSLHWGYEVDGTIVYWSLFDGVLFKVDSITDAAGSEVSNADECGTYTIHLAHNPAANAASYGGVRYFDTSEDFSLDLKINVAKTNLSNRNNSYGTTPHREYNNATLRLKYNLCYRGTFGSENAGKSGYEELPFDATLYPYTGKPVQPHMQILDSSHMDWYIDKGEDPATFALPEDEFDVSVAGYGTTGPVEVNDYVTNPYRAVAVVAKEDSPHLEGTGYLLTDENKFAIVAADISDPDVVQVVVDGASFTGEAVEPAVHFYVDGQECNYVLGEDYALEYANNVMGGSADSDNPPCVTIKILDGKHLTAHDEQGNEVSSITVPFTIDYSPVSLDGDIGWTLGSSVALADPDAGTLVKPALNGTYASPDSSGKQLAIAQASYTLQAGTYEGGVFTAKDSGWSAGDEVWYQLAAAKGSPVFTGSTVVGPAAVVAVQAGNSFSALGSDGCALSVAQQDGEPAQWGYTYTGAQVRPALAVADGTTQLVEGRDFELEYGSNVDAGAGRVTVTGMGAYGGSYTQEFTIGQAQLADCKVSVGKQTFAGGGVQLEPDADAVTVRMGAVELPGSDWSVAADGYGANNEAGAGAGSLTVVSEGTGNLAAGSVRVDFDIARLGLAPARFEVSASTVRTYTGLPQVLSGSDITVTDKTTGSTLVFGTDYTINYTGDHTNAGSAGILVSGLGNYTGSLSSTFTIAPADLSNAKVVLANTSYSYTGTAIKPKIRSVKVDVADGAGGSNTYELEERYWATTGEPHGDYTVAYSNNTNAAAADAENAPTVTLTGVGNYIGTAQVTFEIVAGEAQEAELTVTLPKAKYAFTGKAIAPEPQVRYAGILLSSDDYTVTYANNVEPGTAVVRIKGTGDNLSGSAQATFEILEADLGQVTVAAVPDQAYAFGEELRPALQVIGVDGELLADGADYQVSYRDNTEIGTATAVIGAVDGGAYKGAQEVQFRIVRIPISRDCIELSPASFTYDGAEHKPAVRIVVGDRELDEGSDYVLLWPEDLTSAGGHVLEVDTPATSVYSSDVTAVFYIEQSENGGQEDAPTAPALKKGASEKVGGATYKVQKAAGSGAGAVAFTACSGKGAVSIPDSVVLSDGKTYAVTSFTASAFKGKAVTSVFIGKNVKMVPANAFAGCKKLKKVTGGAGLASIGAKAFFGCKALKAFTVMPKIAKIGKQAFSGCTKLKTVTVKSTKLAKKSKVKGCFKGLKKVTVKVKVGAKKLNKKYVKKYKKSFAKKNVGAKKVTVK